MGYEFSWEVLRVWLTAWSPLITGGATFIVGMIVAFIAWRQWETAKDKLTIDLFDRRLLAWQRIQKSLKDRTKEILAAHDNEMQPAFVNDTVHGLWTALDDAQFLFGPEVRTAFQELDDAVFAWGGMHPHEWTPAEGDRSSKLRAVRVGHKRVNDARAKLREAVEPYMALDKIGVALPAKPFRWPWSRETKA